MPLTRVTGSIVKEATLAESKLISPYVNVSGDTMTGPLVLPVNGLVAGINQLVLSGGKVGINNLNPQYTLDVVGSLRVSGSIVNSDILSVSGLSVINDGTSGIPSIFFGNETNTGIYRSSIGEISLTSTGSTSLTINSSQLKNYSGVFSVTRSASVNSTDNVLEYDKNSDTLFLGRDAKALNIRTSSATNQLVINSIGQVSIGTASTISGIKLNISGRTYSSGGYSGLLLSDVPLITTTYGGTGLTSYAAGDLLYYSSGNTLSRLAAPTEESLLLISANGLPTWTPRPLAVAHGGTGLTILPQNGQLLIGTGTTFKLNALTPGTGVSIINGSGTIGIGITNLPNSSLVNNTITVNAGTGLSGSGIISLGGTIALENTGVTFINPGTGINVSGGTGNVTITNVGVTSAVGGSGITSSAATGSVTFSLDPNYAPNFSGLTLSTALAPTSGGTGITASPQVNEILYGNNSGGYSKLVVIGNGVTISPDFVNNTLTFSADLTGATVSSISRGNTSVRIPQSNGPITFNTANSEVLRVTTSQFIGIGTTVPSCKIDFAKSQVGNRRIIGLITDSTVGQFVGLGLSPTGAAVRVAGTPISIGTNAEVASLGYYSTDSFYNYTSVVYVSNNNRVGINQTSPSYALDVVGDASITGSVRFGTGGTTQVFGIVDTVTTSTSQATIDTFSSTAFRSSKYTIQITNTDNTQYQISEVLVVHDGTNAYITEYGIINSGVSLGVLDATVSGGNVSLLLTPTYANNKVRVSRKLIGIQ